MADDTRKSGIKDNEKDSVTMIGDTKEGKVEAFCVTTMSQKKVRRIMELGRKQETTPYRARLDINNGIV